MRRAVHRCRRSSCRCRRCHASRTPGPPCDNRDDCTFAAGAKRLDSIVGSMMRIRRLHARLAYVRRLHERLSYVVRVEYRVSVAHVAATLAV